MGVLGSSNADATGDRDPAPVVVDEIVRLLSPVTAEEVTAAAERVRAGIIVVPNLALPTGPVAATLRW